MEPRLALLRSVAGDLRAAANARSLVLEEGEELAVSCGLRPQTKAVRGRPPLRPSPSEGEQPPEDPLAVRAQAVVLVLVGDPCPEPADLARGAL